MALRVLTIKLQDGTTQTINAPAGILLADLVRHIKAEGGVWTDRVTSGKGASDTGGGGGTVVGSLWIPYDTMTSITYTS